MGKYILMDNFPIMQHHMINLNQLQHFHKNCIFLEHHSILFLQSIHKFSPSNSIFRQDKLNFDRFLFDKITNHLNFIHQEYKKL